MLANSEFCPNESIINDSFSGSSRPQLVAVSPKFSGITYLACPYSHKIPEIMDFRFRAVTMYAGELIQRGHVVFSPISHSHEMAKYIDSECSTDWTFWEKQDFAFLELSSRLIVLALPGWAESRGVTAEVNKAIDLGIPIEYHTLEGGWFEA